ncbi:respiratory nitrate reductase subunit gamma [Microbulbifer thermotolerans]|uniref:nitrate reductase (quinone) n=1 Tax=Microbulbifer thermotolerans TaxID=252514 RepID=A0A143HJH6_MICTH|nr:respiratory nitrate reductase subunit gamma [Microbulbifer thermotolerans]AMX01848.1 nitrate reductase [Microbulbifer thermotolerans]MCX2779264.1 respiratory nitrate reductase subunit gamma [Microbulbifer thermotolerans]MCX2783990.1 respiratory nitrate reductase subunit gamma [Microbulbifer thermotolerans]MCX2803688.1 respiratory nitrate reductase subunit gamma [Microbulbifer thermotolerans]MCX2830451.1 respiratory nitrate reductase subunit gamma [Microbulbifer thermotolerans]
MNYFNTIFFGIYPFVAFTVFLLGSLIRYDRDQYTWRTGSSQLLEKKKLRLGSYLFHIGVLAILAGHFVGLLTPKAVWHLLGVEASTKQALAMGAGGLFGVICFIGMTILLHRRLANPRIRATSSRMDIVILLMLYVQLILGLLSIFVSAGHMDGAEMLKLMTWAQSIVTLNAPGAVAAISEVHVIYKLHVFLGLTLFLVFPFSRLVHVWSIPVQYFRRNYQIVRAKAAGGL